LQGGLMPESAYSDTYLRTGHPCKTDFITFGNRIGVQPKKLTAQIELFSQEHPLINELIDRSYLDNKTKRMYKRSYQERLLRFLRSDNE
jgi:serine/threonine-protein kinase HipA